MACPAGAGAVPPQLEGDRGDDQGPGGEPLGGTVDHAGGGERQDDTMPRPDGPQVCSCSQRRSICRSSAVISPSLHGPSPTPIGTSGRHPP